MSTYAQLETRTKRRLGRPGMTITTEFLDEMIAAQERLEKGPQLPKFLKKTTANESTAAGLVILTNLPPADFIRVYDDQALVYDDDGGQERLAIRLDTRNQLISKKNEGISGEIFWFLKSQTEIEIAPAQTVARIFRLTYYAADVVLTGANSNLWCSEEGEQIMGEAGRELSIWLRDDRAFKYYDALAAKERGRMLRQIEADEFGDSDLVMGDPD